MKNLLSILKLVFVILVVSTTTKAVTTKSSETFSSVTAECLAAFRDTALAQHNTLRAKHGAQAMTQDSAADSSALNHAKYLATYNMIRHSKSIYGENLYSQSQSSSLSIDICTSKNIYLF